MHLLKNFIYDIFEEKNELSEDNSKYYKKYCLYKKKYLNLKNKLNSMAKVDQSGGEIGKFDIQISGQTNPSNIYQKAIIKYHQDKYLISIQLPIAFMGPISYPIVLQDGRVYSITTDKNNNSVIRFKYKDDSDVKIIDFKVNNYLRKRFSIIRNGSVFSVL
tara:strand:+ start:1017 stop:1499 length:483 start_codon:yes stop_codon:yes gene_type:complete